MISNEIIKILDELCKRFGIAIDWTNQNVMPYLQDVMTRFIKYKMITDVLWLLIGLVLFVLSIILIFKILKWRKSDKYKEGYCSGDYDKFMWGMSLTICMFIVACLLIVLFTNGIIQNICMPELTVIKYIQYSMR